MLNGLAVQVRREGAKEQDGMVFQVVRGKALEASRARWGLASWIW